MFDPTSQRLETPKKNVPSPKTNIAPENGWLEDDRFLWEFAYIQVILLLVSGRV